MTAGASDGSAAACPGERFNSIEKGPKEGLKKGLKVHLLRK